MEADQIVINGYKHLRCVEPECYALIMPDEQCVKTVDGYRHCECPEYHDDFEEEPMDGERASEIRIWARENGY